MTTSYLLIYYLFLTTSVDLVTSTSVSMTSQRRLTQYVERGCGKSCTSLDALSLYVSFDDLSVDFGKDVAQQT